MRFVVTLLVCACCLCVGCSRPYISSVPSATLSGSDFDSWDEYKSKVLDIRFEKPAGRQNIQEGGQTLTMHLHGLSVGTSFPSDTQCLITISFKKYEKEAWDRDQKSQEKLNEKIKDPAWREFRQWAHSLHNQVSMKELDGHKYYRRTLNLPNGDVVTISTEYIPINTGMIEADDTAIRRIMSSAEYVDEQ